MWQLKDPEPVKLIIGILAANQDCLQAAIEALTSEFGKADLISDTWPFTQTDYYNKETGENILRRFVTIEKLIDIVKLAKIKHKTNKLEQKLARHLCGGLAKKLNPDLSRPVNLDPGVIEPSKLILATTKNYSHRIYIGKKMFAEVTLVFDRGAWCPLPYTYPDYKLKCYHDFFDKVRARLLEQLKSKHQPY